MLQESQINLSIRGEYRHKGPGTMLQESLNNLSIRGKLSPFPSNDDTRRALVQGIQSKWWSMEISCKGAVWCSCSENQQNVHLALLKSAKCSPSTLKIRPISAVLYGITISSLLGALLGGKYLIAASVYNLQLVYSRCLTIGFTVSEVDNFI